MRHGYIVFQKRLADNVCSSRGVPSPCLCLGNASKDVKIAVSREYPTIAVEGLVIIEILHKYRFLHRRRHLSYLPRHARFVVTKRNNTIVTDVRDCGRTF